LIFKVINLALVAIYAIGSGLWVSTGDAWYRALKAPSWQPPDWVFGLIWPYNFAVLAIAGWVVVNKLSSGYVFTWLSIFAISIVCALSWAYLFYIQHAIGSASVALCLVALLTIPLLIMSYEAKLWLGLALTPYQLWVITASALSYSYYKLN
jgi:tryptophan-rich sensory protein